MQQVFISAVGVALTLALTYPMLSAYRRGRRPRIAAFLGWVWLTYTCGAAALLTERVLPLPAALVTGAAVGALMLPVMAALYRLDAQPRPAARRWRGPRTVAPGIAATPIAAVE